MNASGKYKRAVRMQDLLPANFRAAPMSVEDVQRELIEKQQRFEAAAARRREIKLKNPPSSPFVKGGKRGISRSRASK